MKRLPFNAKGGLFAVKTIFRRNAKVYILEKGIKNENFLKAYDMFGKKNLDVKGILLYYVM